MICLFDVTDHKKVADAETFSLLSFHFSLLEVLPVLHRTPGAAPLESVLQEKPVEQIALDYLIGKSLTAVDILRGRSRLYDAAPVLTSPHVWIVEGVDVDGHTHGVLGELGRSRHPAITEAGGIIVAHRPLIVSLIVINQTDALDGIFLTIEFTEDFQEIVGNGLVAYHLTHVFLFPGIKMRQAQIAQISPTDRTVLRPGTALHPLEYRIRNRLHGEFLSRHPDGSEE